MSVEVKPVVKKNNMGKRYHIKRYHTIATYMDVAKKYDIIDSFNDITICSSQHSEDAQYICKLLEKDRKER